MMKNAILVHGFATEKELLDPSTPTESNSHWFPWISKQLMVHGIHTVAVEMPVAKWPVYADWKREFERYDVTNETILVGHSCGGGFLVRWLSEHSDMEVAKLVLVAPWMGIDFGEPFDDSFFDFTIDSKLANRAERLVIISSDNDFPAIQQSVERLLKEIDTVEHIQLHNKGHFIKQDLGTEEFLELKEAILN